MITLGIYSLCQLLLLLEPFFNLARLQANIYSATLLKYTIDVWSCILHLTHGINVRIEIKQLK